MSKPVKAPTKWALEYVVLNAEEQLAKYVRKNKAREVAYWQAALDRKRKALEEVSQ